MSPFTAQAVEFTFVWSDTIAGTSILENTSIDTGVDVGDPFTFSITVDNGGLTTASQTWTSADFVSATVNIDSGAYTGEISTIDLADATGSFITDGSSAITFVPSSWDSKGPGTGTDSLGNTQLNWFINGDNAFWVGPAQPPPVFNAAMVNDNLSPASWTLSSESNGPGGGGGATPEPSTFVLAVLGVVGLTLGQRPRRRRG